MEVSKKVLISKGKVHRNTYIQIMLPCNHPGYGCEDRTSANFQICKSISVVPSEMPLKSPEDDESEYYLPPHAALEQDVLHLHATKAAEKHASSR